MCVCCGRSIYLFALASTTKTLIIICWANQAKYARDQSATTTTTITTSRVTTTTVAVAIAAPNLRQPMKVKPTRLRLRLAARF